MPDNLLDLDYFAWRERAVIDGEERLLVPWSDPRLYEFAFDFIYLSKEEALEGKDSYDEAIDEDWVLVHYNGTIVDPSEFDGESHAR
jgi:hypothetical protein